MLRWVGEEKLGSRLFVDFRPIAWKIFWILSSEETSSGRMDRRIARETHNPSQCGERPLYWGDGKKLMDHLFTPWRYAYVTSAKSSTRPGVADALSAWPGDKGCVFCNLIASIDYAIAAGMNADEAERAGGLIKRGKHCFICLNAFPYSAGHVMVVLYEHLDRLAALTTEAAHELIDLGQQTERALQTVYQPQGFNIGMNVGQAGGAGVAGHLHMHALPRWLGDTNFMTTIGETRMLPEDLETTWRRMREAFVELGV